MRSAPFPPLVAGGATLQAPPPEPTALRRRMAEVYSVDVAQVLVVRGFLHGAELVMRVVASANKSEVVCKPTAEITKLAAIARLSLATEVSPRTGAFFVTPDACDETLRRAAETAPALLVIDESLIEASDAASAASLTASYDNLVVIRSLEYLYGLAGAPCGALIASPSLIDRFSAVLEPSAIAAPVARLALDALDPTRAPMMRQRAVMIKSETLRVAAALGSSPLVASVKAETGGVTVATADAGLIAKQAKIFGIAVEPLDDGGFFLPIGPEAANDRLLSAFAVGTPGYGSRRGDVVRDSLETRIAASVDLDKSGPCAIETGIGFFDHMLMQIATHAGISITLNCDGDLEVDAHHTIEDCAIALGQALSQALGERRGIARFGFLLPMDEAEAKVSVDLGGRPYLVFDGDFSAPLIGAYPTEMTEHVFRSLSQSLNAAIHVAVTGKNDHHKTEACFKAFGRALRQAIVIESGETRSTKGFIL
jgi:imidazoleglycerol phosphate dehydratase HisB/histidinol-phosphate/aromatic aminotransferase/cobyric acid decarboxylase-like protein